MGSEAREQMTVAKVPLELLFTDYIEEDKTKIIPHFTKAWYEDHKRFADLPIIRLSPHLQLFRYFMNGREFPQLYLEWHSLIHTTRGLQVPISEQELLEQRRLQYSTWTALFSKNADYFLNDPIFVAYDKKGGYFRIKDGHHRTIFQYCRGVRYIPARMTLQDYNYWKNTEAVEGVKETFSRHQRTLIYTPILNPYFEHLTSERDSTYPTRLDLILEHLGSVSVRGKNVLDIGCNIGYYSRHFARQGARVTGYEPMAEHYELARELNHLERVQFDIRTEHFERTRLKEEYEIGLLLTVFYHVMDNPSVRQAFLRNVDRAVTGLLFWESGAEPGREKEILLQGTKFDEYEKLGDTEGTGKKREFGVFKKSSYP